MSRDVHTVLTGGSRLSPISWPRAPMPLTPRWTPRRVPGVHCRSRPLSRRRRSLGRRLVPSVRSVTG